MITINAGIAAIMAVLPSAVVGFCFWLIERKFQAHSEAEAKAREKRQAELDEREKLRKENEIMVIKGVSAAIELAEATARAVQRIPDAKCNGDMHSALEYASTVKHEQKAFFERQSVNSLYTS